MREKGDGGGTIESDPSGKPDGRLEPYLRLLFILYLFQALRLPLSAISVVDPNDFRRGTKRLSLKYPISRFRDCGTKVFAKDLNPV